MWKFKDKLQAFLGGSPKDVYKTVTDLMYGSTSLSTVTESRNECIAGAGIGFAAILTIVGEASSFSLLFSLVMFAICVPFFIACAILNEVCQNCGEQELPIYVEMIKSRTFIYTLSVAWLALFIGISMVFVHFSSAIGILFVISCLLAIGFYFFCYSMLAKRLYRRNNPKI